MQNEYNLARAMKEELEKVLEITSKMPQYINGTPEEVLIAKTRIKHMLEGALEGAEHRMSRCFKESEND